MGFVRLSLTKFFFCCLHSLIPTEVNQGLLLNFKLNKAICSRLAIYQLTADFKTFEKIYLSNPSGYSAAIFLQRLAFFV